MKYTRGLKPLIMRRLFSGKAIVLFGARQVGKTTLVKEILDETSNGLYLSGDDPSVAASLSNKGAAELKAYLGDHRLVIVDEAQRIENIGVSIKLLADNYPDMQIIATGSSSFELANKINEPLTGRAWIFNMYPLSFNEITCGSQIEKLATMKRMLRYGSFPGIWTMPDDDATTALRELSSSFLFKDLLEFEQLKKAPLLTKLLQALSLQLGNEVSLRELSSTLEVDIKTIERYIFLLEQVFIVFRLPMLKRNPRGEVGKLRKIYFCDLGLRNSLIRNFNELDLRTDTGALWENFCVLERIKHNSFNETHPNYYFWRSYSQKEVDLVEEYGGTMHTYKFKWGGKQAHLPKEFVELYPGSSFVEVTRDNFTNTLLPKHKEQT